MSRIIYEELYSLMATDPVSEQRKTIIPDVPKSLTKEINIEPFKEIYQNVRWRNNKS